jgi:hypothetical protein
MGGIFYSVWSMVKELQKNRTSMPHCFSGIPEAKKESVSKEGLTQIAGKAGRH